MERVDLEGLQANIERGHRLIAQAQALCHQLDQTVAATKESIDKGQGTPASDDLLRSFPTTARRPDSPAGFLSRAQQPPPVLLLVEDSDDDFLLLERSLRRVGFHSRIVRAKTGAEALAQIAVLQHEPVFILLDIHLPDMDGFSLCEEIRARTSEFHGIRFAFWSGHFDRKTRSRADAFGVEGFFSKELSSVETAESLRELVMS